MTITVRDNGFKKRMKALSKSSHVTAGVHADDGSEEQEGSDLTVADIAGIHEFGLGVPERSWLRDFVDGNKTELNGMLRDIAKAVLHGADAEREMERFGLVVVGMIKERIIAGIKPPLAPETLLQKARLTGSPKETPLVLFGQLVSSIAHRVNL